MDLPVRPRENLVITVPVTANPTRKGQFRFHSRLKKTDQGSNSLIFSSLLSLPLSLSVPTTLQHLIPAILLRYCLALKPNGFSGPNPKFITLSSGLAIWVDQNDCFFLQLPYILLSPPKIFIFPKISLCKIPDYIIRKSFFRCMISF